MRILGLLLFLCFVSGCHATNEINGRVVGVSDGDTITVLTPDKRQIKVRLSGIDCPESGQPWGRRAKEAASNAVYGESVSVQISGTDRYGRSIGKVFVNDVDLNRHLVKNGHCWVYRRYAKDQMLFDYEEWARDNSIGLWGLPEASKIPPWEWRKR